MAISNSPYMEKYSFQINEQNERDKIKKFVKNKRKTVVVQGLGFVGQLWSLH